MMTFSVRYQIAEFVERAPIKHEAKFDEWGNLLGFEVRSTVDSDLFIAANRVLEYGIRDLKRIFKEKLEKDFLEGKPLPFKLKEEN